MSTPTQHTANLVHTVEGALAQPLVTLPRKGKGVSFPVIACFVSFKVGLKRLALRPFTFSNGVTIPAGTLLALPIHSVHADEEMYPNAHEFDAFRLFRPREKERDDVLAARHQLVTTLPELLGLGDTRALGTSWQQTWSTRCLLVS